AATSTTIRTTARGLRSSRGARSVRQSGRRLRKCQRELAAYADRALHRQIARHSAGEIAADRKAEPNALARARETRVDLHERLENARRLFFGKNDAGIGDP